MKKILLTVVLSMGMLAANAADFKFGIKLGATISSVENRGDITGSSESETFRKAPFLDGNVAGFTGGVAAKIDLWKGFGIDPELMFQQISGKFNLKTIHYEDGVEDVKYKVYTLAVPVMLRYRLDLPGRFAPMVFTGPVVSFKIQSGYSYAMSPASVQCDWRAGVGMMLNKKTEIAASYNIGLGNFTKYAEENAGYPDISNRASYWTVTLGYFF